MENVFDWSKFKACSHGTYSFEPVLINSSRYLQLGLYIKEIMYVNTNSKGNQSWNKNKHFHLFLILVLKNPVFIMFKNNFNFSQFHHGTIIQAGPTCRKIYKSKFATKFVGIIVIYNYFCMKFLISSLITWNVKP